MSFTLTYNPQLYGLEMSLSNFLMIGWFLITNIHLITNICPNKQTSTWKGNGQIRGNLKICHMSADSFVFRQKIYCSFLQIEGVGYRTWGPGITKLIIFCGRHKFMTPKWFKITTNSTIRGSSFFLLQHKATN